ncbi:AGAP013055-PA-like protein [Anopheles sinensis]|uniref:AGAP013055-PA-like protein n=1 Tax=Anopheles sinensis TaxID=74873 RepID=A0A084VX12_ANOSI|nr:AGAP013055-PA-like protein [Anopheles sinensis]
MLRAAHARERSSFFPSVLQRPESDHAGVSLCIATGNRIITTAATTYTTFTNTTTTNNNNIIAALSVAYTFAAKCCITFCRAIDNSCDRPPEEGSACVCEASKRKKRQEEVCAKNRKKENRSNEEEEVRRKGSKVGPTAHDGFLCCFVVPPSPPPHSIPWCQPPERTPEEEEKEVRAVVCRRAPVLCPRLCLCVSPYTWCVSAHRDCVDRSVFPRSSLTTSLSSPCRSAAYATDKTTTGTDTTAATSSTNSSHQCNKECSAAGAERRKTMEIHVKQCKQRNRRRERAQRMIAERDKDAAADATGNRDPDDSADEDSGPLSREKPHRPPVRRKRKEKEPSPVLEEDIIDGFAILAFKTYEDIEFAIKIANKRNEKRLSSIVELTTVMVQEEKPPKIIDTTPSKLAGADKVALVDGLSVASLNNNSSSNNNNSINSDGQSQAAGVNSNHHPLHHPPHHSLHHPALQTGGNGNSGGGGGGGAGTEVPVATTLVSMAA